MDIKLFLWRCNSNDYGNLFVLSAMPTRVHVSGEESLPPAFRSLLFHPLKSQALGGDGMRGHVAKLCTYM